MPRAPRILALDDSLTMRKLIEVVFASPAFELCLATTGAEALAAIPRFRPDIILLDYVLPDMQGTEVCEALSHQESLRSIPVLVTSAKGDRISEEFRNYDSVVGFLPKPFKPAEIQRVVAEALRKHAQTETEPQSGVSSAARKAEHARLQPAQLERAARSLFAVLQAHLARVPEWLREAGAERPERHLGRKLLTARVIEGMLEALQPIHQEIHPQEAPAPHSDLAGSTSFLPLDALLEHCQRVQHTGTLVLQNGSTRGFVHLRGGTIVLASLDDPQRYLAGCGAFEGYVSPESRQKAEAQQRRDGTPVLVTYAEEGSLSLASLALLLQEGTRHSLVQLLEGSWSFRVASERGLPAYADAHGQPYSLDALRLVELRRRERVPADWRLAPSEVLQRNPGFSERIQHLDPTADERKVLTLVNGRNSLAELASKSGMRSEEAHLVVWRLQRAGLIQVAPRSGGPARPGAPVRPGKVLVLEPDEAVVVPLLRQRLSDLRRAQDLVLLRQAEEIESFVSEQVEAVILNCSAEGLDPRSIVERVRGSLELADLMMIGILEPEEQARAKELEERGFDAVLVKPFLLDELDAYLAVA